VATKTIVTLASAEIPATDVVVPQWYLPFTDNIPVTTTSMDYGNYAVVAWSPDGMYLASGFDGHTPFLWIYKRTGDSVFKIGDAVGNPPYGGATGVAWSPNGQYLAVAHALTPFISVYKRNGDVLTKLNDPSPSALPPGPATSVSWSPSGDALTVGHATTPFATTYSFISDAFTKWVNPTVLPASKVESVSWSPNGVYMITTTSGSLEAAVYKRSGVTLNRITALDTSAAYYGIYSAAWSPNGRYLMLTHGYNPLGGTQVTWFKRNGDAFIKLPAPVDSPNGAAGGVADWSPDGRYVAIVGDAAGVFIYRLDGETLISVPTPSDDVFILGGAPTKSVAWSPSGEFLTVGGTASPYIATFKAASPTYGGVPKRITLDP
jgi:WD40 repeat protein